MGRFDFHAINRTEKRQLQRNAQKEDIQGRTRIYRVRYRNGGKQFTLRNCKLQRKSYFRQTLISNIIQEEPGQYGWVILVLYKKSIFICSIYNTQLPTYFIDNLKCNERIHMRINRRFPTAGLH